MPAASRRARACRRRRPRRIAARAIALDLRNGHLDRFIERHEWPQPPREAILVRVYKAGECALDWVPKGRHRQGARQRRVQSVRRKGVADVPWTLLGEERGAARRFWRGGCGHRTAASNITTCMHTQHTHVRRTHEQTK